MMSYSPDSDLTDGTEPAGAVGVPGREAGVNSEQRQESPAAPARNVPTLWLPDSWAQPLVSAGQSAGGCTRGVAKQSNSWDTQQTSASCISNSTITCVPCWPSHPPTHAHPCVATHPLPRCSTSLQCDNAGVQPNSLIELAKRALALTVHQLALYRKVGSRAAACMPCLLCSALLSVPSPPFCPLPLLPAFLLPTPSKT